MNRYKLVQLIATGGMGEVFLARSEGPRGFAKTLVIKRILRHLASEPQFVEMFLNEARLAAMLSHPNIVQIFELGEEEGTWYIAMEYIHGRTLRAIKQRLLHQGQLLSPVLAARVCAQALQGLHYAHNLTDESGQPLHVVHRDISPDNVMVGFNGQVKVVDFGIAKATNAISTTRTGMVKGKYSYMAPEQLLGQPLDARTDVYAMGVLLYELLTGARPWVAPTEPALIQSILNKPPPPPRERNPSLPTAVNALILRALEKDPAARFASAEEMAQALEGILVDSGHSLTQSQVGAFLKDLFGAEAAAPPTTQPGVTRGAAEMPRSRVETVGQMARPAVPEEGPTELLTTPISTGARQKVAEVAAVTAPPGLSATSGVQPLSTRGEPPHAPVSRDAAAVQKKRRPGLVVGGVVTLFVFAVAGAYFAGRVESQVAEAAPVTQVASAKLPGQVEDPVPVQVAAPTVAPGPVAVPTEDAPETQSDPAPSPEAHADAATAVESAAESEPAPPKSKRSTQRRRAVTRAASATSGPGKVELRVNPWAEVVHGGKSLGITPMAPVTVPSGKQTFTLRNKDLGVTRKVTVTVPAGGEVVLRADLFE